MGRRGRAFGVGVLMMASLTALPACNGSGELRQTANLALAGADRDAATGYARKWCGRHPELWSVRVQYFGVNPAPGSRGSIAEVRCPKRAEDDR
jgi:hypothetical protein